MADKKQQFIDLDVDRDWSYVPPTHANTELAWRMIEEIFAQDNITSGAGRANLSILSQVTLPPVSRRKRDYHSLIVYALAQGARITALGSAEWDISGDCSNPYSTTLRAPPVTDAMHRPKRTIALYLDILTRCRRCQACLNHRAALWRIRAKTEVQDSFRTWLGTFTLEPYNLYKAKVLASDRVKKRYPYRDFNTLTDEERFREVHSVISEKITLRLNAFRQMYYRKHKVRPAFKYLIVAEAHKSGEPHYHLLIHEKASDKPIRYEELRHIWPHGFYHYRLVKPEDNPVYLCKYLSKSMLARVRASQRYGHTRSNTIEYQDGIRKTPDPHKKPRF